MRAIAEEAFALVREYKGSHSGEHGDGISRSEFPPPDVRRADGPPTSRPSRTPSIRRTCSTRTRSSGRCAWTTARCSASSRIMRRSNSDTALDWSAWGGLNGAAEMCNNNGACRKFEIDVMCPSFRATRDEKHLTRGPRQYPAPRALGPARPRRPVLRRHVRDHAALRQLQGLQARMPDRRRHRAHEDRVPVPARQAPRREAARTAGRLSAALRQPGRAHCAAAEPGHEPAGRRLDHREDHRFQPPSQHAQVAARPASSRGPRPSAPRPAAKS